MSAGVATAPRPQARDLPDGLHSEFDVQSSREKYSAFPVAKISTTTRAVSPPTRGVSRSSRTRGGMRWTRQRFARDVSQGGFPVSDNKRADERCSFRLR